MNISDIFQSRKYKAILRAYTYVTSDGRVWTMPTPFALGDTESTTAIDSLRLVQFGDVKAFYNNIVEVSITEGRKSATSISIRLPYETNASKYGSGAHATQELQVLRPQTFASGDKKFILPSLFKGSYLYRLDIVPYDAIDWTESEASILEYVNHLDEKETYFMYLVDSNISREATNKYMDLSFVDVAYLFQTNLSLSYPEETMYERLFATGDSTDAELLDKLHSAGVYPAAWDGWSLPNLLLALMHYAGMLPPNWVSFSRKYFDATGYSYVDYEIEWSAFKSVVLRIYGDLNDLRLPYSPSYPDPDENLSDGYYFKTNPYDTIASMLENFMQTLGVNWRIDPATGMLVVFLDSVNVKHSGELTESYMASFGYNYNDSNLRNAVTVLGRGYGAGQMYSAYAEDSVSISYFGRRHMVFQHQLILSNDQAKKIANNILKQYAFNIGSLNVTTPYAFKLKPYDRLQISLTDENITMGVNEYVEVDSVSKTLDWLGIGSSQISLVNVVNKVYIPLEELYGGEEVTINDLPNFHFGWSSSLPLTNIQSLITTNLVRVPLSKNGIRVAWYNGKTYKLRRYMYSQPVNGSDNTHRWEFRSAKTYTADAGTNTYIMKTVSLSEIKSHTGIHADTWTGWGMVVDLESEFSLMCLADGASTHTTVYYVDIPQHMYDDGVYNYTVILNYRLTYSGPFKVFRAPTITFVAIPLLNFSIDSGVQSYDMKSLPTSTLKYALLHEVVRQLDTWKQNPDSAPESFDKLPFPAFTGVDLRDKATISFVARQVFEYQTRIGADQLVAFNLLCRESSGSSALLLARKFLFVAFIKAKDARGVYHWVPIGDYVVFGVPKPNDGLILKWTKDGFEIGPFTGMKIFDNSSYFSVLREISHDTYDWFGQESNGNKVWDFITSNDAVDLNRWTSMVLSGNVFNYNMKYACKVPYRLSMIVLKYQYSDSFGFLPRYVKWSEKRLHLGTIDLAPTASKMYVYKTISNWVMSDLNYSTLQEWSADEPNVFLVTFIASPFMYYDAHFYLEHGYSLMTQSAVTHGSDPTTVSASTYPVYFWAHGKSVTPRSNVMGVVGIDFN